MSDWRALARQRADQPPLRPRVPLWAGASRIGSVEPRLVEALAPPSSLLRAARGGWELQGAVTASLHQLACALRDAGLSHAWRDEQLAVTDEAGAVVGTVERAVVRSLGIMTHAVHLAGIATDGRHWVQQRSLTKANDPGLWDTLMGGMVPAADSLAEALERETWEEAGLRLAELENVRHGGCFTIRRPTGDGAAGYVIERIDWFKCVVPAGLEPRNQDGEVERFDLLDAAGLEERLGCDAFTLEAALVLDRAVE